MWTGPFSLDWSWLVVLSCHRNFKTSKCRSALSSTNKTFLETALIQSKRRKFITKMLIISSHKFNFTLSSEQARNDLWMRILLTTKCKWVFLSSDSWASSEISRFPFFTVFDSGEDVSARSGCGNGMSYIPQEQFSCCAFRWMQFIRFSTRSSHFFVSTCSNKQS